MWTYLIPTKQHVFLQLKQFFAYVETQFYTTVQQLRSDHGTEFHNASFQSYLLDKGVVQQSSCVGTPAQNGRVERKHRQLLAIARALCFQSGLPIKYWGECILASTYIINRLPTPVLEYKSPFECLYSNIPDYDLFRVFGCLYYASIHESNKFHPRAIRCVFIGYPHGNKGFKLLNLDTKHIFVSRHVVFHESVFPFLEDSHTSSNSDPYFLHHWLATSTDYPTHSVDELQSHSADEPNVVSTEVSNLDVTTPVHSSLVDDPCHDNTSNVSLNASHDSALDEEWSHLPPDNDTLTNLYHNVDFCAFSTEPFIRKSTRERKRPAWWDDYQISSIYKTKSVAHDVKYPMATFVSTLSFSPDHAVFLTQLVKDKEPKSFAQAVTDSKWVDAMNKELDTLEVNHTW